MLDVRGALTELNNELRKVDSKATIYICGGAELILLGFEGRTTTDIDAILSSMDDPLYTCALNVTHKLNLKGFWLNNSVSPISKKLPKGWKKKCTVVFSKTHLKVLGISRQDLISTKMAALINRRSGQDEEDINWLKPTKTEFSIARDYIKNNYSDPLVLIVFDAFVSEYFK